MSRDNWERLVSAVVKKQQLWEMFHAHSRSPSISTIASSEYDYDDYTVDDFSQLSLNDSPLLLDAGKRSFGLCTSTGKKCYMLSARQLQIAWADNPTYWSWTSSPDSRFTEVAELRKVCWLDIRAIFEGQMLSPNTTYAAYLVFKLSEDHYGLDCSSKAAVQLIQKMKPRSKVVTSIHVVPPTRSRSRVNIEGQLSSSRSNGWLEIELGQFFIGEGDQCRVQIQLSETEQLNWKRGLIVEKIEIRPKNTSIGERFLPPDYREIIDGSDSQVAFTTKKELYFLLCDSALLLDGAKVSFGLCRSTGKKCYMLSARQIQIVGADNPTYWTWTSLPDSRFTEVAKLQRVCWLDIQAKFQLQMLSPKTRYAAYLVFKLSEDHFGLDCSSKASVQLFRGNETKVRWGVPTSIYVVQPTHRPSISHDRWTRSPPQVNIEGRPSSSRSDGWLEIELGQFFSGEGDKCHVKIRVSETEELQWKRGLIVQGIDLRPKEAF